VVVVVVVVVGVVVLVVPKDNGVSAINFL
jgi:hypothetical protein